jgi:hypothetical protein
MISLGAGTVCGSWNSGREGISPLLVFFWRFTPHGKCHVMSGRRNGVELVMIQAEKTVGAETGFCITVS